MPKQSHFYPHFITRDNSLQLTGNHLVFSHTQDITHLDNDFSKCSQDPKIVQNSVVDIRPVLVNLIISCIL